MPRPREPVLQLRFEALCDQAEAMGLEVGLTVSSSGRAKSGNASQLDAVIVWPEGDNPRNVERRICAVYVLDRPLDMVAAVVMEELRKAG